jgi:hypothetical protein
MEDEVDSYMAFHLVHLRIERLKSTTGQRRSQQLKLFKKRRKKRRRRGHNAQFAENSMA